VKAAEQFIPKGFLPRCARLQQECLLLLPRLDPAQQHRFLQWLELVVVLPELCAGLIGPEAALGSKREGHIH
jgi:hypothetical protein